MHVINSLLHVDSSATVKCHIHVIMQKNVYINKVFFFHLYRHVYKPKGRHVLFKTAVLFFTLHMSKDEHLRLLYTEISLH